MSKVKHIDKAMNKTKLRHNLRRIETAKKKKTRMKNAQADIYPMFIGYVVNDCEWVSKYETIVVPQKIVGEKIVPEHTERRCVSTELVDIPARLKRCNPGKKQYRKIAQRKMRNTPVTELYQMGQYKKLYDVMWEVGL